VTLPLAYVYSHRMGNTVARVRERENIRSFLTGHAMAVMLFYSVEVVMVDAVTDEKKGSESLRER
jgi:ABC-type bacteriocin/lantibiotic exporter with double-glycine peptidase domain